MRFLFTAILLLLLVASSAMARTDSQLEAYQHIKAKNFSKALDCFNEALKQQPKSWAIMQSIGNCHMELGHYDTAITYFQKSIETGGLQASQCSNMAAVYQRTGQPQKALSWLRLACSVDPAKSADPQMQAAIRKLQDPANNPIGSPTAPDYLSSLVSYKGWSKQTILKVYVRQNIQMPGFHAQFISMMRDALDQWCAAAGGLVSYKLVNTKETANVMCDYTDRRELVSSDHELGIDGNTEMLVTQDVSVRCVTW